MADFTRKGYGQVEPNQLSAPKTGQIYASLPLADDVKILQNGEFMKYAYVDGEVNATQETGEWMLVFNEIKLYDDAWRGSRLSNFAMIREGENYITQDLITRGDYMSEGIKGNDTKVYADPAHTEYGYRMKGFAPRLFKTNVGDIYTTNMVKTGVAYKEGDTLTPVMDSTSKTGVLEKTSSKTGMLWQVVKVYTMPDGQPGLKLQRIQ